MPALNFADGTPTWSEIALVVAVAFVLAHAMAAGAARMARAAFTMGHRLEGGPPGPPLSLWRQPVLGIRLAVFALAWVLTTAPLLELIGENLQVGLDRRAIGRWLAVSGLRIAVISLLAYLVVRLLTRSTLRLQDELMRGSDPASLDRAQRAQTLGTLLRTTASTVIVAIAALMVLRELGVDIMPLLTGAGIAGVALGFGAQYLVRDIIAGFFMIIEDQVRVGDAVAINGTGGAVESLNLRTVVLRDVEGTVHIFQNGNIQTLANRSRDFAYSVLDLAVDFGQDTDRVVQILREASRTLEADAAFASDILEPLEVLGVDAFRDGLVVVRSRLKTRPGRQFDVGRELRRRVHHGLTQAGIDLPPAGLNMLVERARRGALAR